jgi:hypothetical protein
MQVTRLVDILNAGHQKKIPFEGLVFVFTLVPQNCRVTIPNSEHKPFDFSMGALMEYVGGVGGGAIPPPLTFLEESPTNEKTSKLFHRLVETFHV